MVCNGWPIRRDMSYVTDTLQSGEDYRFILGAIDTMYAAEDIVSCCHKCGNGCGGGFPLAAMDYFTMEGVVTGGLYEDQQTCKPYTIKPCEHHVNGTRPPCTGDGGNTPKCQHKCIPSYNPNNPYAADKVIPEILSYIKYLYLYLEIRI